jgi:phosphomannomutase/phosphomannomutase/phosphoglucomutase
MPINIPSFKAYDIRGRIPDELNGDIVHRIANATAAYLGAKKIVVGRDIRLSSDELSDDVCRGLLEAGVDVLDIGLGGTEMVYFATGYTGADGGIMITASHNPADYNGLKIVKNGARPISGDTGLTDIRRLAEADERLHAATPGDRIALDINGEYIQHLLGYVDPAALKPLKIVVNAGNGGAGLTLDRLEPYLPFEFVKIHHKPDGEFPNGVPNPMLEQNRKPTVDAIRQHGADLGIAWDGDFDRCFFFDETGAFVEGYYIVGLLAEALLRRSPGEAIVHDPRLTWNTLEIVKANGGRAIQSKSGHSFMKETLRREDAVYGGEMSAHHYFRDFYYCDSGMVPWLLVAELVCQRGQPLSDMVAERIARFPASGEINRKVDDAAAVMDRILADYAGNALDVDRTDGISVEFSDWRFNLRSSNTEPVIRLNVETRGDAGLMRRRTDELLAKVGGQPA